MKKRIETGLFCIVIVLILLLNLVSAVELNPDDSKTWYDNKARLIELPLEKLVKYSQDTKALFQFLNDIQKEGFNKEVLKEKAGYEIEGKGLGDSELKWEGDKLKDSKGRVLDAGNLPKDLVSISYDRAKGFIYDFGEGKSITMDEGGYGKSGFYETNSILDGAEISSNKWEIVFSNGHLILNKGAEVKKGDITYSQTNGGVIGDVEILSDTRAVLTNAKAYKNSAAEIIAYNKPTLAVFDNQEIDPKYSKQYARVLVEKTADGKETSKINFYADKIDIKLLSKFDEVKGTGLEENGVKILDGDVPIVFKGKETKYPRTVIDAEYSIGKIINELDSKNVFSLQKIEVLRVVDESGRVSFKKRPEGYKNKDSKETIDEVGTLGTFLINEDGKVLVGENKLVVDWNRIPIKLASYSLELDKDYIDRLPEGINSEEEFAAELQKQGKVLSLELLRTVSQGQLMDSLKKSSEGASGGLKKLQERYQGKSNWEQVIELGKQAKELKGTIEEAYKVGTFASKYYKESLDFAETLGGTSYDPTRVGIGYFDGGTKIEFDSRKEPGIVTITSSRKSAFKVSEPMFIQRTYPREFVDGLINNVGIGKIVSEGFEEYRSRKK